MGPEILHFSQIPRWTDTGGRSKPLKHEQPPHLAISQTPHSIVSIFIPPTPSAIRPPLHG